MSNTVTRNMRNYPVRQQSCQACPFESKEFLQISKENMGEFVENVLLQGQHICANSNKIQICRGLRNIQLKHLHVMGLLAELTDKAFDKEINDAMQNK